MNDLSKAFAITALAALVLAAPLAAPARAARPEVFFDGEKLSAVAFETPIRDLLDAITAETGLRFHFLSDAGDEIVDVEIFEVSPSQALERILEHRGHGRVGTEVWISAPAAGFEARTPVITAGAHEAYLAELGYQAIESRSSARRLAAAAELVRERSAAAIASLEDVFATERNPQVRASVFSALDRSGALSIRALADVALDDEAGMLRRKAIELLARRGAGDPTAESTLAELADRDASPMIRATARMALRGLGEAAA